MTNPIMSSTDQLVIEQEALKLGVLLTQSFKAQKSFNTRKEGLSNDLLRIAQECGKAGIFTQACDQAEAAYKAIHAKARMPAIWTASKSRINAMFVRGVPFVQQDGSIRSFSECAKELTKRANDARKAAEALQPECLHALDALVTAIKATGNEGLIELARQALAVVYSEWEKLQEPEKADDASDVLAEAA